MTEIKSLKINSDGESLSFVDTLARSDLTNIDTSINEIINARFQIVEALPENPVEGIFYFVKE